MERVKVIKIGGNVVDSPAKLSAFLTTFSTLGGLKILVHGGGKIATAIGKSLGIEATMVDGRRVTDEATLDVVTMVYAGLINKKIVAQLQSLATDAVGICGADGGAIRSIRRAAVPVDYGFVGDPAGVNVDFFATLLGGGFVPVVAPITMSDEGQLLNTNADTVAQTIAVGLSAVYETELVYCFEKRGVLDNVEDENSVIPHIDPQAFESLKSSQKIADGMLPKLENALRATAEGVASVRICSWDELDGGTTISQ